MGDYFSAEGYIMLGNESFPLSLLHFCNLSFHKYKPTLFGDSVGLYCLYHCESTLQGRVGWVKELFTVLLLHVLAR